MLKEIKNRIDARLRAFMDEAQRDYSIKKISPLLYRSIREFVLRPGKRLRPILFVIGYKGFCGKEAAGLYSSCLCVELLHDFLLIHDDIIDRSKLRRGRPSMHMMLQKDLAGYGDIKFNGEDLGIIAGDVIFAMAMSALSSIKEEPRRKEAALKKFVEATVSTGAGEFIDLLSGAQNIEKTSRRDIYKIYYYKTALYTFSSPLCIGATLAGAKKAQLETLREFGVNLGVAFQIKDDILGAFGSEEETGKSELSDLQERKKTLLLWHAYNKSTPEKKKTIKDILGKRSVTIKDLSVIRSIIRESGALDYAKEQIKTLSEGSRSSIQRSAMKKKYKEMLLDYSENILA